MHFKIDERGSKDQKILYQYLHNIYKGLEIIYEYPLYELNQRIDIYIPSLNIAFEYNGRQHYEFVPHFHKNIADFHYAQKLDLQKEEYLIDHGIKLVIIPYDKMVNSPEELKQLIEDTPYPGLPYRPLPTHSEKEIEAKTLQKEKRKELYQKRKQLFKEDPDVRKERLKKEKQLRKERYLKMKENT